MFSDNLGFKKVKLLCEHFNPFGCDYVSLLANSNYFFGWTLPGYISLSTNSIATSSNIYAHEFVSNKI